MTEKSPVSHFEANLQELEALVEALESGELSLEESLSRFEHGIKMTRECQQALSTAEQRVKVLLEKDGELALHDFDGAESD